MNCTIIQLITSNTLEVNNFAMPLIVISGFPSSGKTFQSNKLTDYFEGRGKKVHIVSENKAIPNAGFCKNEYFADSQKEKQVRADLMSAAHRHLNKEDVVILDGGNYIKGYRYQLFCATKSISGNQCTVFCAIQKEKGWEFNQQRSRTEENLNSESEMDNSDVPYTREIYDALCMRYEEPHGNHRWDSPLFVIFPGDELDYEAIYGALFESKPLPPNKSTENPPLSDTNYLYELDKITQKIVSDVISARKIGIMGSVPVQGTTVKVDIPDQMNAAQLNRLRRQFLTYSKMHSTSTTLDKVPQLFVQYLNSNFNK